MTLTSCNTEMLLMCASLIMNIIKCLCYPDIIGKVIVMAGYAGQKENEPNRERRQHDDSIYFRKHL